MSFSVNDCIILKSSANLQCFICDLNAKKTYLLKSPDPLRINTFLKYIVTLVYLMKPGKIQPAF